MNVSIIGCGYVGIVSGLCLSKIGHNVVFYDVNEDKINNLKNGILPIYEPGLSELFNFCLYERNIIFTNKLDKEFFESDIYFITVGTPSKENGDADLTYVFNVAQFLGKEVPCDERKRIFITKSTVPVGTTQECFNIINRELNKRNITSNFSIANNPEFLSEGCAIQDFMKPDRVVIGIKNDEDGDILKELYSPILNENNGELIICDVRTSEMIKYAFNAMLATRISYINEISCICKKVGADIEKVSYAMGCDKRIGKSFLKSGCGYGGSCFPKDVNALIHIGRENLVDVGILESVVKRNILQKEMIFDTLKMCCNENNLNMNNIKIGIWGLSFKPNTNDIREAPSLTLIRDLKRENIKPYVYDPMAMEEIKKEFGDSLYYVNDKFSCVENSDVLILLTEWEEFSSADLFEISQKMKHKIIIDGRGVFNKYEIERYNFKYYKI